MVYGHGIAVVERISSFREGAVRMKHSFEHLFIVLYLNTG
jgi:hypothetical protein